MITCDAWQMFRQTKKTISSPEEFLEFLKTEESLHCSYLSECELYCLANILGTTIHLITYSSKDKQAKWDTFKPQQSLVHSNKFAGNKQPMYCLYERGVGFNRVTEKL